MAFGLRGDRFLQFLLHRRPQHPSGGPFIAAASDDAWHRTIIRLCRMDRQGLRAPAAGQVLRRGSFFARELVRRRRDEGVETRDRRVRRRPCLHVQLLFEDGMDNEIISYIDMCQRESSSLQRGMNFELGAGYSVILMSVHPNAPYRRAMTTCDMSHLVAC